jgi:uncharacterized membrane protein YqjE
MSAAPRPAGVPPAPAPSLFTSVRTFWRVLLTAFHTRLDLFTTELGEEAFRLLYLVIAVAVGLVCLHTAFFFFMVWILAACWETGYRLWVIGGIALVYLIIAVVSLLVARKMILGRPRFLGHTLEELRRDVEGLHSALKPRDEEEKP